MLTLQQEQLHITEKMTCPSNWLQEVLSLDNRVITTKALNFASHKSLIVLINGCQRAPIILKMAFDAILLLQSQIVGAYHGKQSIIRPGGTIQNRCCIGS